jgi:PAS domain S-box-containing protein
MDYATSVEMCSTADHTVMTAGWGPAFKALADAMPSMVWITDAMGEMTFCNAQWRDYTGMTQQEAINKGWIPILHPDDLPECRRVWELAQQENIIYRAEARYRRHDGEYRWFLTQAQPMRNGKGEIIAWYGTGIDITERKEMERLLHKSLERERLIRNIVQLISQSFDIDHILKTVAEETGRYFAADRCSVTRFSTVSGELVLNMSAQYCREGCKPVDPDDINLIINAVRHLSPEAMVEGSEQIINISDQEQYLEFLRTRMESIPELPGLPTEKLIEIALKYDVRSSLRVNIYYRGLPYGSISLNQCSYNREWLPDEVELLKAIAEQAGSAIYQAELYQKAQETAKNELQARKELEIYAQKLEASNRELEQFATIASHDLQEPLRKIKLFGEMLSNAGPEESAEYLKRMQNATARMQNLISDLLTLSRVQRKGNPFKPVNLSLTLQTVLDDLHFSIREAGAEIQAEPLSTIRGDESQIRQLFQNIIGNALKYQRENVSPRIRIYGHPTEDGQCYQVTVEDNGIGINAEHIHRIFEPFQRLHGSDKYPGTGIGLTICKKIVERHRGKINVESEPDQGSRFTFTLPINSAGHI